jgi:hypothetical protein
MKKLKLMICILLSILLLPMQSYAAFVIKPEPGYGGGASGGSVPGGGTPFSVQTAANRGAGLLLHVQQVQIPIATSLRSGETLPRGFQDAAEYWTTHFPDTDPNEGYRNGFYLIPEWAHTYSEQSAVQQENSYLAGSRFTLTGQMEFMVNNDKTSVNQAGKDAFTEAQKNKSVHNHDILQSLDSM